MNIDIVNSILKGLLIFLCLGYVFMKIINYKSENLKIKLSIIFASLLLSILYTFLLEKFNQIIANTAIIFMYALILQFITKNKLAYTFVILALAIGIVFGTFFISTLISSVIAGQLNKNINNNSFFIIFLITIFEILFLYLLFKIKRFNNGFSFAKNKDYINNFGILGILCSGIIMIIYSIINFYVSTANIIIFGIGITLLLLGLILWIKKQITNDYKQSLKTDTINQLEEELAQEKLKNEKANIEIERLAKINHKYSTRIAATENYVKELANNMQNESSEELSVAKDMIDKLSNEYKNELSKDVNTNIQMTKIPQIDSIINYFYNKTNEQNIEFIVENNCNMRDFIAKTVSVNKIETMLGDHIKDALIAIGFSENKNNSIKLKFDKINDKYQISIYDTGIEFEIDTLLKLGKEQITTHKDTGGSGIGFVTTFETLRDAKASLVIKEFEKEKYSKAVILRFDNKNEYKIISYRADEIRKQNKTDIIVEDI